MTSKRKKDMIKEIKNKDKRFLGGDMKRLGMLLVVIFFLVACGPAKEEEGRKGVADETLAEAEFHDDQPDPMLEDALIVKQGDGQGFADAQLGNDNQPDLEELDQLVKKTYYHQNKNLIAPFILLGSADADQVNKEIEARVLQMGENKDQSSQVFMTYQALLNERVLSVLIQMDTDQDTRFLAYNFDIDTGQSLFPDQVLNRVGLNWEEAANIFYQERKAYWSGLNKIVSISEDKYPEYINYEIDYLHQSYAQRDLPIILGADGFANMLCILLDEDKNTYWQLYCLAHNRVVLLQSNAYGAEFPAVIIASPDQEEMSSLKLVRHIKTFSEQADKKSFLLLPLWYELDFQWQIRTRNKFRENKADKRPAESQHLELGEAIYIEMAADEVGTFFEQASIKVGGEEVIFSPSDFQALSRRDKGILYLPLSK